MGFLSAKELRKKRFGFRKSNKKEQDDEQQEGTDEKEKSNKKTNNKNKKFKNASKSVVATPKAKVFSKKDKQQQIQQKNLEPPEATTTTTTTTPRTVIGDDDDDDDKMTGCGGGGTPGSPERNLSYTRSTDSRDPPVEEDGEGNYAAAGELSRSENRNLLGQINVVEDDIIQDVIGGGGGGGGVDNDGTEEGTEIVVGKLPSHKKDPEGNIQDDVQHYNSRNNKAAATGTNSSAANTIRVPYNPNEVNNNDGRQVEDGEVITTITGNDDDDKKLHVEVGQEQAGDDDYDEYPADELRQSLSAPMFRSSSSATAKNQKQQQQQQRHVAERSANHNNNNNNNNNRNYGDDDDHVLKTDPPLVSSKSIDLGDLKDNAEYTARKLLGVFSCVPEELQQRTYRAVEGVGTVVETGCDMPAAVCQQMGMKQGKRGIKRNLSFYNDQFAVKFLDEILNVGFAVIHHVQSGDGDWSGRSATLILRPGTCNANNHTPPRLEWSSMGGGTQSHIETDSVSLLHIHSLTSSSGDDGNDDDDSFNNDDDEEKEELQCLFTLTTTKGIIEVFEAITPDETAKLVTGIKNISAKFAQQLISGDDHAFTDYYSQHSDTDFIKLTPPEAMSLMTHDFLDSL